MMHGQKNIKLSYQVVHSATHWLVVLFLAERVCRCEQSQVRACWSVQSLTVTDRSLCVCGCGQLDNPVDLPCSKERLYPLGRKLGGPYSGSRPLGVNKNLFLLP